MNCNSCKLDLHNTEFEKRKDCKSGYRKQCKSCRQKIKSEYYKKNREKLIRYKKDYYNTNKESYLKKCSEYSKNNRPIKNAARAKRRSLKLQATPPWADLEKIKLLYKKAKWLEEITGFKYHVDHIIPLSNDNVCGLHVWSNLQILESSYNLKKGNKNE